MQPSTKEKGRVERTKCGKIKRESGMLLYDLQEGQKKGAKNPVRQTTVPPRDTPPPHQPKTRTNTYPAISYSFKDLCPHNDVRKIRKIKFRKTKSYKK